MSRNTQLIAVAFLIVFSSVDRLIAARGFVRLPVGSQHRRSAIEHKQYIDKFDQDLPEIRNWQWGKPTAANGNKRAGARKVALLANKPKANPKPMSRPRIQQTRKPLISSPCRFNDTLVALNVDLETGLTHIGRKEGKFSSVAEVGPALPY